ncbi:aminoacylase-1-like [Plodia interpunctella]|uniref:aminoacylase-1-like n=1 Tax=Plodia interpunctella TaxID=58824 RepID=UPI00236803B0|nr:aminoacylase-1-like [Plodia interpunctella]
MISVVLVCGLFAAVLTEDIPSDPVELLRQYVQINTTTGNDLSPAVEFWTALAEAEGVPITQYEFEEGYPVLVLKWEGADPSLDAIMLNSHMDVVPADEADGWTYPPFEAFMTDEGDIYGRGTQDMKSVAIQYYDALRRIKANNVTLLRTVYMTLMPDEEIGGEYGMIPFVNTTAFYNMNVGIELDEGTSYDIPIIPVFYQDKSVWQIQVDCYGVAGHGSTFPATNSTATGKCRNVIDIILAYRDEQYELSTQATIADAGIYTSVNLNKLNGGTANNVLPNHVSLTFDMRLGTRVKESEFQAMVESWIAQAGDNVTLTYISKNKQSPATRVSLDNPYWAAIVAAAVEQKILILPIVPPGSTDARHVRSEGTPAFGFSPMPNTPLLLHSVDEHLNAQTFLDGINIYQQIITNLASIPGSLTTASKSSYLYSTVE